MRLITFTNPNLGSNWLLIKLWNIPGILDYYHYNPIPLLLDDPWIVSTYCNTITKIVIYENNQVHYTFSSRPDMVEILDDSRVAKLVHYLQKLGWRGVTIHEQEF